MQVRLGMHWLLASGAVNIVTFGDIEPTVLSTLNFALVPQVVLVESHGVLDGEYETHVRQGSAPKATLLSDFINSLLPRRALDGMDPEQQTVFPLYYQEDTFNAARQSRGYFRHVLGRFNWWLQNGICPDCGIGKRHAFDQMHLDHVIPVKRGGNNTLLNVEMRCSFHNLEKNKRLSETKDYVPVARAILRYAGDPQPGLSPFFSLEESHVRFPVQFRLVAG